MQGERRGTGLLRRFLPVGGIWIEAHALLLPERMVTVGTKGDRAPANFLVRPCLQHNTNPTAFFAINDGKDGPQPIQCLSLIGAAIVNNNVVS
jgi:hypothetical protein